MPHIHTDAYDILFGSGAYNKLLDMGNAPEVSSIFIIVDSNTQRDCLSRLRQNCAWEKPCFEISIRSGERYKTLETCLDVWEKLSNFGADRKSLIINLGGGVVTDLGAFVASTFKRGVRFVNIPTSLLAMVDASVGGKTGVDLGVLKNQIGTFALPELVIIDTTYLRTLPEREMRSGMAEMLKHALIHGRSYWDELEAAFQDTSIHWDTLISKSVAIKHDIVTNDPKENGIRKALNLGHTLGHAIESYCLSHWGDKALTHGEAIAAGMVLELYLSNCIMGLSMSVVDEVKALVQSIYGIPTFDSSAISEIIALLQHDKKNTHGQVNFVLLRAIGEPALDKTVPNKLISAAFDYYHA